jgi:ABC-type antimicrobial peptide transport system permease subunit
LPSLDPGVDHPQFYQPFDGILTMGMLGIRCGPGCPNTAVIHKRILSADSGLRPGDVFSVVALEDRYFEELARPRAAAALGSAFAGVAVLAAAGGLFSVLSYAVGRRKREFGIRTALGASPGQIRRLVLRNSIIVALTGIAVGSIAAWFLGRALESLQYGVSIRDSLTWAVVLGLLGLTTLAASWRPARQAMRADPMILLREE